MPHGERAARKENKRRDYWSPRPGSDRMGGTRCPYTKKLTHRLERRQAKRTTKESQ